MNQSRDDAQRGPSGAEAQATGNDNGELQRIVEEAALVARTTMAAISIRRRDYHVTLTKLGLEPQEVLRLESLCNRVVRQPGEPLVILDALRDVQFASLPTVLAAPFVRFYIGIPLVDRAGYALGAFYVADHIARQELPDLTGLKRLAREAERVIARH